MAGNKNLHDSLKNKQDEFYTKLSFIENEIKHYPKEHFYGKTVLCNCDDPYESNFFKYFAMSFNDFKLKKLIATCYATSKIAYTQFSLLGEKIEKIKIPPKRKPYKIEISNVGDENGDGRFDLADVEYLLKNNKNCLSLLAGDGDFRSEECVQLMREADVVVTNPPFSLFREYIGQLESLNKKYLIVGNLNAAKYKEMFPLIAQNKVWLGYQCGHYWFGVPDNYEEKKTDFKIDENGKKWRRMGNICWFTNLDIQKRHDIMPLFKQYSPNEYKKYDTYDAINIDKTKDIPFDYDGIMGVPITFLDKYNPDQFEILGELNHGCDSSYDLGKPVIDGIVKFPRILIRKK